MWKQAKWGAIRDIWIEEHNNHKHNKNVRKQKLKEKRVARGKIVSCDEEKDEPDKWASSFIMMGYYFKMHTYFIQLKQIKKSNADLEEGYKVVQQS